MKKNNKKIFLNLFFLVVVFVFPIVGGDLLYSYRQHLNFKTLNYGTIVNPAVDVSFLYNEAGLQSDKKWRIIQVTDDICNAQCEQTFMQLRQVKKALGKDSDRVLVVNLDGKYPRLAGLTALFAQQGQKNFSVKAKIYLVDPLGNLFMYYPDTTNLMNVLKDMQRVLEVSQIG